MDQSMMDRHRAETRAALYRRLKQIAGIVMILVGLYELGQSLLYAIAPVIFDNLAGSRTWPHLVFGLILIGLGSVLVHRNQE